MRTLIVSPLDDAEQAFLKDQLGELTELAFLEALDESQPAKALSGFDVVVAGRVHPPLLQAADSLKLWVVPWIGLQQIITPLRELATTQAFQLACCPWNAERTAQTAVALLLAAAHHLPHYDSKMREGGWRPADDLETVLLGGKTLGLLGYGRINQRVESMLQGFDVTLIALNRSGSAGFGPGQIDAFFSEADCIVAALPETPETIGLVGAGQLRHLGRRGVVVNVGRGSVFEEQALFEALASGTIAAAGLDVWWNYRPEPEDGKRFPYTFPFHTLLNVVLSPHRASSPRDNSRWEMVSSVVRGFIESGNVEHEVDLARGY